MVPACVLSSTWFVMAAPGRHSATRIGSVRRRHTASGDALTTKDFEISIAMVSGAYFLDCRQLWQHPFKRFEVVRGGETIDEGERRLHGAGRRLVSWIAGKRVQPDNPTRLRAQRPHGARDHRRIAAIQTVAENHDDRPSRDELRLVHRHELHE